MNYSFPKLWTNVFAKDVVSKSEHIRTRAVWLLGCLDEDVSKADPQLQSSIFHSLCSSLSDPSLVVRLASAWSIEKLVTTCQFHMYRAQFLPFLPNTMEHIVQTVMKCEELDTQNFLMGVIQGMIQKLGDDVKTVAEGLLSALPPLWQRCERTNILRTTLVDTVSELAKVLGTQGAEKYQAFFVHIIQFCTGDTGIEQSYLLERGLALWVEVLRQTPVLEFSAMVVG